MPQPPDAAIVFENAYSYWNSGCNEYGPGAFCAHTRTEDVTMLKSLIEKRSIAGGVLVSRCVHGVSSVIARFLLDNG